MFTLIVTLWVSGLVEQRLNRATHLDVNYRVVLAKFVRAVLLIVGVLIALQAIGFDLTLLSVFGGALGVGIGLGLQKLASNYIAGFTILIDRSIRPGDIVTVDNRLAIVSRLTSRYVVVRSMDGVEAIVPNETLVTTTVLNHTYSSRQSGSRSRSRSGTAATSLRALDLMDEAARREPRVLAAPAPPASIASFAENRRRSSSSASGSAIPRTASAICAAASTARSTRRSSASASARRSRTATAPADRRAPLATPCRRPVAAARIGAAPARRRTGCRRRFRPAAAQHRRRRCRPVPHPCETPATAIEFGHLSRIAPDAWHRTGAPYLGEPSRVQCRVAAMTLARVRLKAEING